MMAMTESIVEEAALAWFEDLDFQHHHGPELGPDDAKRSTITEPERSSFDQVLLERRLRDALARLNPDAEGGALDEAWRKLTRISSPQLVDANHEYPANPAATPEPLISEAFGTDFVRDDLNAAVFGALNADAVRLMDEAGYD